MKSLSFTLFATAMTASLVTTNANAVTLNTDTCNEGDVTAGAYLATACYGEVETNKGELWESVYGVSNDSTSGGEPLLTALNDATSPLYTGGYNMEGSWSHQTTWYFGGKDEGESGSPVDYGFNVTNIGGTLGTWDVLVGLEDPFAISLKASSGFGVYFFENGADLATYGGTWDTSGLLTDGGSGNTPALSHASLYVLKKDEVTKEVPESGLLLGVALVGATMLLKRKLA